MNTALYRKLISYLVLGIVGTLPFLFGAVHPIISGLYVCFILIVLGSWLLCSSTVVTTGRWPFSIWIVVPLWAITYLVVQAIPLPLSWLDLLSPLRGERLHTLNELAGTSIYWASLSESGPLGIHKAVLYFSALLYYLTVRRLLERQPAFKERLIYVLIGVGTVEALYGLLQFVNPQIGILWLPNPERAAHGTIIYKNQYASMVNMIWPLAIAVAIGDYWGKPRKKSKRKPRLAERIDELTKVPLRAPLCLFSSILMMLAVLFSLSRGGILSMVITMLALMIFLPISVPRKIGASLVILTILGGYSMFLGLDTVLARFSTIDQSGTNRLSIYLYSLTMLTDHWLTGIGMGSYAQLSPIYLKGFPLGTLYDSAHNEYLELLIELGIPFATMLFIWIFWGLWRLTLGIVVGHKNSPLDLQQHMIGVAALSGLVGFLVHGVVDFGWRLPVNLIYSTTLIALCISSIQKPLSNEAEHAGEQQVA